jgi:hypothetical protein
MSTTPTDDDETSRTETDHHTDTCDGDDATAVATIREALQAAKDVAPDERDAHLKAALGEIAALRARQVMPVTDLQEQTVNALVAPSEETPYFVNRALDCLGDVETELSPDDGDDTPERDVATDADAPDVDDVDGAGDTPTEPPECVRWLDDDHGVLELELERPFIEWLELEADRIDSDGVADYVRTQLWVRVTEDLRRSHGFTADVDVDVPPEYARRVSLWQAIQEIRGDADLADTEAFIYNHMELRPTWRLDGEPWDLLGEGSGTDD